MNIIDLLELIIVSWFCSITFLLVASITKFTLHNIYSRTTNRTN